MVQKIIRLSEEVINKIAAGEVVENPASIIKELIENSLDAKAQRIDVWIEGGGEYLIRVEDDGCGMGLEDARLSLERYATSKIRTEQDLQKLATMGFRGEALAAIASVSLFELRTSEGGEGTRIVSEGGTIRSVEPCARNRGTTIEVRSLFFNVPARKKFMKSRSANLAQAIRAVETIALAHPEVAFSLKSENKTKTDFFPETQKKRIENLLGPMPHEIASGSLRGFLAPAEEAKLQRRGQYLFVNRRSLFSPLISKAVKMGYGTRIAENAHPSFVLFLELSPEEIDVNVHPQKKEIRFSDERKIFRLCEQGAASVFESTPAFSQTLSFSNPSLFYEDPLPQPTHSPFRSSDPALHQDRLSRPSLPLSFDFPIQDKPLAIIGGYFLLQTQELLLIDLSAAHARVLYESLKEKKGEAQALMWPIEIAIDCEEIVDELQKFGIECRLIGNRTLAIDALPSWFDPSDFSQFLLAWSEGKRLDDAATRYAKSAKKRFHLDEALFLWKQLLQCRDTCYDPSGKLIWKKLDSQSLRKILEGP